ncbi:hypothetical protein [Thioalkalivibrio sp. ALJ16]|uniref:hypothetical protein n=1 Tax=Thioalkalivibrio sp. ALJ16 TaxID=1158762 RepID=UPI0012DC3596|nr:hypothetical protein [Thioalkalivibrio sp. ALJ16]
MVEEIGEAEVSSERLGFISKAGLFVEATDEILKTPRKMAWKFSDWRRKWLQYYSALRDLRLMSEPVSDVALADEGPIHKLVAKVMRDEVMKDHWKSYCKKAVSHIVSCDPPKVVVVKVNTDPSVRFERRKNRGRTKDASLINAGTWEEFKSASRKSPSLGTMEHTVVSSLKERLGRRFIFHEVDGARGLSEVSSEVVSLIREHCGQEEAPGNAADG